MYLLFSELEIHTKCYSFFPENFLYIMCLILYKRNLFTVYLVLKKENLTVMLVSKSHHFNFLYYAAGKPVSPCKEGEFRCGGSNQCIPESKVCDAHKDCTNGEDEPASCGECCLDALGVGLFR